MGLVEYSVKERVGYITLNRPEKRNALNQELVDAIQEAFERASKDDAVKVVVLRANGESFCAGADLAYLKKLQSFSFEENLQDSRKLKELLYRIYTLPKIVIAQVEGSALAGGCGLVTVCDFVWAVPYAKFGYTEVKIGFVPAIVMTFLLRKIGEASARELLLTGKQIPSEEAAKLRIVTHISGKDKIEREVYEFAQQLISETSAQSISLTKRMINEVQNQKFEDALDFAAHQNAEARSSDDCRKGTDAFLNKRMLKW